MAETVSCTLKGLYPKEVSLATPLSGHSYVVFDVSGFSESGVHAFIRLVPAVGVAMARSNVSMDKAQKVGDLAAVIANMVGQGGITLAQTITLVTPIIGLVNAK